MNSKEIVKKTLKFEYPSRIPLCFEEYPFIESTDVLNAYISAAKFKNTAGLPIWGIDNKPGKSIDEWGCIWKASYEHDMGAVVYHPLKNLEDIKNYKFPNPYGDGRFKEVFRLREPNKYMLFWIFCTLFERLYMLHGFNETLIDLTLNTRKMIKLIDIILDFQLGVINNLYNNRIPVDGIGIGDDWGTENSLFISPYQWRKIFKKRYAKIVDLCHKCGYDVWLHCDGKINEIMDDFIEVGIDAINLMSPDLLGIEEIGKKYKGKITFFSSINHQNTLSFGDEKKIRIDLERIINKWGSKSGGIVLYFADMNATGLGISIDRQKWIVDIIKEYTNYYNN